MDYKSSWDFKGPQQRRLHNRSLHYFYLYLYHEKQIINIKNFIARLSQTDSQSGLDAKACLYKVRLEE
jgi:hypothetical protein